MKVLHFSHHFLPCVGGIEKVVLEYCRALKKSRIEASVVCLNRCPNAENTLPERETIGGIEVERIPFINLKYYKIAFGALKKIRAVDILHLHGLNFFSDLLLLLKPFHKKKIVLTTYGGVFHTKNLSLLKKIYFFGWNRLLLSQADMVIAISKNDYELFARIVPREKIVLLEIGADVEKFSRSSGKKQRNSFVYIGRLSKNKRLDLLVKAFSVLAKKEKNAKLHIVGRDFDGTQKQLNELVRELGLQKQVFLTGYAEQRELEKLAAKAEFFVSASEFESFGISVAEAMAAGCIPVLSPIPTFKGFVKKGSGFIIDFSDTQNAGKKLVEIAGRSQKEREEVSEQARVTAMKYSWEKKAAKIIALYGRLA